MCVIYAQLHCISITIAYRLLVGSTFLCSLQRVSTSEFPGFKLKRSSSSLDAVPRIFYFCGLVEYVLSSLTY